MGRRSCLPAFDKVCEKFEGRERLGRTCHLNGKGLCGQDHQRRTSATISLGNHRPTAAREKWPSSQITATSASKGCAAIERSIGVLAKFQIVDTVNLHSKGPGRNDNLFLKDYNLSSIMIFFSYSSIGYKWISIYGKIKVLPWNPLERSLTVTQSMLIFTNENTNQ